MEEEDDDDGDGGADGSIVKFAHWRCSSGTVSGSCITLVVLSALCKGLLLHSSADIPSFLGFIRVKLSPRLACWMPFKSGLVAVPGFMLWVPPIIIPLLLHLCCSSVPLSWGLHGSWGCCCCCCCCWRLKSATPSKPYWCIA